jgi:hypothetical protein
LAASASTLVIIHLLVRQRELETLDKHEMDPSHSTMKSETEPLKEEEGISWEASVNITQFDT